MSPILNTAIRLQIFARIPELGKVKTRLQSSLGEEGCLILHQCLMEHALDIASQWQLGPVELWLAGSESTEVDVQESKQFSTSNYSESALRRDFSLPDSVSIHFQQGENLGKRMRFALQTALEAGDAALLIGTDCPQQRIEHLLQACEVFYRGFPLVIQPAEDGGFVMVGCCSQQLKGGDTLSVLPEFGNEIEWGSNRVLEQFESALHFDGILYDKIVTLSDLDTKEDLYLLQRDSDPFMLKFESRFPSLKKC